MLAYYRKAWLSALRTGHFKQSRHKMRVNATTFCALGLACKMVSDEFWTEDKPVYPIYDRIKLDLDDRIHIHRMNRDGKSFREIADWIERNINAE